MVRILALFGVRKYTATLHHRAGPHRTVPMSFYSSGFEQATAKAWRWGSFDNWVAVTVTDGVETIHVEAPDDVMGWWE